MKKYSVENEKMNLYLVIQRPRRNNYENLLKSQEMKSKQNKKQSIIIPRGQFRQ